MTDLKHIYNLGTEKWEEPDAKYKHREELRAYGEITGPNVVCPLCFHEDQDCWEYMTDARDIEVECRACKGKFSASMEVQIDYTTRKLP